MAVIWGTSEEERRPRTPEYLVRWDSGGAGLVFAYVFERVQYRLIFNIHYSRVRRISVGMNSLSDAAEWLAVLLREAGR